MKLSERIRSLREKAKLTQRDLAGKVGVSNQAVWFWERGVSKPEDHRLEDLAAALGVTKDDLEDKTARQATIDPEHCADCAQMHADHLAAS